MFAVYAARAEPLDPLSALVVGERPEPELAPGWIAVRVRAASINHHDLWTLRGVGIAADAFPMILGCDAAGIDPQGREVVVHSVIGGGPDETLDPARSLLSEKFQGTFADIVVVPAANVVPKPRELSWAEAACLPTAWLTAYRMLVTRGQLQPGETILVQGVGGGVATACIALGRALGLRVWATSRDQARSAGALELGADAVFVPGARLPERVDAVMETVGAATWEHSVKSLRPGGRIVISGATTGANPPADLTRIFFKQLSVIGSTMGTREELADLIDLCLRTGLRPLVDRELPMSDAAAGLAAVAAGDVFGKIVLTRD
ncbi:MAG: Zn-dependent oxidoreductase [Actinobacteria bacterium]|nr:MAG: Zn-dependent oxidoreductase [Actinomycetota bacterium]